MISYLTVMLVQLVLVCLLTLLRLDLVCGMVTIPPAAISLKLSSFVSSTVILTMVFPAHASFILGLKDSVSSGDRSPSLIFRPYLTFSTSLEMVVSAVLLTTESALASMEPVSIFSGTSDSWQKSLLEVTMEPSCRMTSIAELFPWAGTESLASPVSLLKVSFCSMMTPSSS